MKQFHHCLGVRESWKINLSKTKKTRKWYLRLNEILQEVEKLAIQYGSSFINKNNRKSWKQDKATVKQINACKSERIKTKWDAHKHFSRRNMWYALRDIF